MGWVQIAAGAYYLIGSAVLLRKFATVTNFARPNSARVDRDNTGAFGLVGAKAGLILDQKVDGTAWTTKVPVEYHFKRKTIPPALLDDWAAYEAWVEQNNPKFAASPGLLQALKKETGGQLPKSVEFYIHTEWWDNSFNPEQFPSSSNHRFYLENTFSENTMAEYEALNNPAASSTRTILGDADGLSEVADSTQGGPPDTSGTNSEQWAHDQNEPITYGVIQPRNMGGGVPVVSFFDDVQLTFTAKMVPRVETTSYFELLLFFGWGDPASVNLEINAKTLQQQIDYDLY